MYSKITKILVLSVLVLLFISSTAVAQEWVVTAKGDKERINISQISLESMTLREAISKANSGDTITFAANITEVNVMYGTLNISKDLTIGGHSKVIIKKDPSPVTQDLTIFTVSDANVVFRQLTIENGNVMNGLGGAVLADKANLTFDSCIIQRNRAGTGGAIYAANGSYIKLDSTSVYRNNATVDGSAIYIKNGTLDIQNSVIDGHSDRYNVIRIEQGTLIANQARIINNEVKDKGSPVNASAGTTVEFRSSTFSNNTATESAGITSYGTLTVANSVFDGGVTSGSGGGIALKNGATGDIRYSIFSNSTVTNDGGGIHVDVGSRAIVDTCTFINNLANYGGAFFSRGDLTVTSSTAVNNTAKFYGGALASWNDGTATLTKNIIAANTARSNNTRNDTGGGGLNISNSNAMLSNNVIVGNTDPRTIDFGEANATVRSGGNNLLGTYRGTGRFPIDASDVAGIVAEDVFVLSGGLPSLTKPTGHTAGYNNIPVYTVELNSSSNNPAAHVLGESGSVPEPQPPQVDVPQTPPPQPPVESSGSKLVTYLMYSLIFVVLIIVLGVGVYFGLKYRKKKQYEFK